MHDGYNINRTSIVPRLASYVNRLTVDRRRSNRYEAVMRISSAGSHVAMNFPDSTVSRRACGTGASVARGLVPIYRSRSCEYCRANDNFELGAQVGAMLAPFDTK